MGLLNGSTLLFPLSHEIVPRIGWIHATLVGWEWGEGKIRGGWGRSTILYVVRFRLDSVRLNARLDRYSSRWVKFHRSFFWVDKLMDRPLMNFIWKLGRNFSISWRVRSWIYFHLWMYNIFQYFLQGTSKDFAKYFPSNPESNHLKLIDKNYRNFILPFNSPSGEFCPKSFNILDKVTSIRRGYLRIETPV